jgi:protoporphyrin/coproporphyrin ferrochelatase
VLVTNLGTPDAPETGALRRYLKEFLWDPRVVEVPRPLWWLILNGVILRIRPSRSAKAYRTVWTEEGSPLLSCARAQVAGISERLAARVSGPVEVVLGMRYGNPSIPSALAQLQALNVERLLVLPLYPQYSASTTASTFDAVAAVLMRWRWIPELRFITRYHDEHGYLEALAASIREHWAEHGRGEHLVMSFHGVPRRYLDQGDPYHCQCVKTGRLLAERLGLEDGSWSDVPVPLRPRGMAQALHGRVDPRARAARAETHRRRLPGFSADCLETLEEIAEQNAEFFHEAGGETLSYIPCLNTRDDHLDFLADLALRHLQGWPETGPAPDAAQLAARRRGRRRNAPSGSSPPGRRASWADAGPVPGAQRLEPGHRGLGRVLGGAGLRARPRGRHLEASLRGAQRREPGARPARVRVSVAVPDLGAARPGRAPAGIHGAGDPLRLREDGADQFNEAGFRDPAGQVVTLLEARTWSPAFERARPGTVLGHFREYRYAARDPAATVAFWARSAWWPTPGPVGPRAVAGGISLAPVVGIAGPGAGVRPRRARGRGGGAGGARLRAEQDAGGAVLLRAPDGLRLRLERGHC